MLILLTLLSVTCGVWGHGRLMEPPSRSAMWRRGYPNPPNYNDNEHFCGGFMNQVRLGGKCGVCGDPWQDPQPRAHEAGGKYANGIIPRTYMPGQTMDIVIDVTANHMGWFEFRLCPNNNISRIITHECLDRHLLELADGSGTRWFIPRRDTGFYHIVVRLPEGLTCSQCVLQWKWHTGNSWGRDPDGRECVGCGDQEEFYGCSDIAIGENYTPYPSPPSTPTIPAGATEPTPSPWPTRITGKECEAIGVDRGRPGMDSWCQVNCVHFPPNCPRDRCRCFTP